MCSRRARERPAGTQAQARAWPSALPRSAVTAVMSTFAALGRRLPQLDFVTVGIDKPAETAVFVLLDFADDLRAAEVYLAERAVEIVDDQVEHELARGGSEVIGLSRKRAPHDEGARRQRARLEFDRRLAVTDAEPLGVPRQQPFRIRRFEEHSAEADDSRHAVLSSVHRSGTDARTVPARSCRATTSTTSPVLPRTIHSILARSSVT